MKLVSLCLAAVATVCGVFAGTADNVFTSANGKDWCVGENWSQGVSPNGTGAAAVIGIPSAFKKNKGWRNIHVDAAVTVGSVSMTCGGCTNRIDTGDTGGDFTFDGGDGDAVFTVADESGAGLALFDLDEPYAVRLATDATFAVPNAEGDAEYGAVWLKGLWDGNGKNLKKSGAGLLTVDFAYAEGAEPIGKLQVEEGVVAILRPITLGSITKSGACRVQLAAKTVAEAKAASVVCAEKMSVDTPCLFVPTVAGNETYYGGFASPDLKKASKCKVYVLNEEGDVRFAGQRWKLCEEATVAAVEIGDGFSTYKVDVPEISSGGGTPTVTVEFKTKAPSLGNPIEVKLGGDTLTTPEYRWLAWPSDGDISQAKVVSTAASYVPVEADLEHWIQVEVGQGGETLADCKLYFSRLPVVYMTTDDGKEIVSKEEYVSADLLIQGNAEFAQQYAGKTQVKGRGNTSWQFYPQKPYKLKLDKKTDLFGFGKNKHWTLLSSFLDKAMLRNKTGCDFAKAMGIVGMDQTWVALVYNGDYHGVYQLCEHVRVDPNRVDIFNWEDEAEAKADALYEAIREQASLTGDDKDSLETQMVENLSWITSGEVKYKGMTYRLADYGLREEYDLSGGYLIEFSSQYPVWSGTSLNTEISRPEFAVTDPSMKDVLTSLLQRFESAYRSPNGYDGSGKHYSQIADIDSMAAYWLVNEILANQDNFWRSRYCFIDRGKKLKFGPAWDFDIGSACRYNQTFDAAAWRVVGISSGYNFYREWISDPYFCKRARDLYWRIARPWMTEFLKNGGQLDQEMDFLKEAGEACDARWFGVKWSRPIDIPERQADEDMAIYKDFLVRRMAWLDAQFGTLDRLLQSLRSACARPYDRSAGKLAFSSWSGSGWQPAEESEIDVGSTRPVKLRVAAAVAEAASLDIYVNGIKYARHLFQDGCCDFDIERSALSASAGSALANDIVTVEVTDAGGSVIMRDFCLLRSKGVARIKVTLDAAGGTLSDTVRYVNVRGRYGESVNLYPSDSAANFASLWHTRLIDNWFEADIPAGAAGQKAYAYQFAKAIPGLPAGVPYTYVVEVADVQGSPNAWVVGHSMGNEDGQDAQLSGSCWHRGKIDPGVYVTTLKVRRTDAPLLDRAYLSVSDGVPLSARFRISLFAGGGVTADSFEYVRPGEVLSCALPVPTRANHVFLGWAQEDGTPIDEDAVVRIPVDHRLVAQWKKVQVAVSFDANGGMVGEQIRYLDADSVYGAVRNLYPNGTVIDLVTSSYTQLSNYWFVASIPSAEDQQVRYALQFMRQIPDMVNGQPYSYIVEVADVQGSPDAWVVGHSTGKEDEQAAQLSGSCWHRGNIDPGVYVTTLKGRRSDAPLLDRAYVSTKSCEALSATYRVSLFPGTTVTVDNYKYVKPGEYLLCPLPVPVRAGYEFVGWQLEDGTPVDETMPIQCLSDHRLVAQWHRTVKVTFDANGGTLADAVRHVSFDGTYGASVNLYPSDSVANFASLWHTRLIDNWFVADIPAGVAGQKQYAYQFAKAIPDLPAGVPYTYVVEVDSISGPVSGWCAGHTTQSDSYQPAQLQGSCWTSGEVSPGVHVMTLRGRASSRELLDRAYLSVSDGLPLTARFRISLFAGGGVTADNFEYVRPGEALVCDLPTPTRSGYSFAGWQLEDGTPVDESTSVQVAEDHRLVARWSPIVRVTFDANGGVLADAVRYVSFNGAYGESVNLYPSDSTANFASLWHTRLVDNWFEADIPAGVAGQKQYAYQFAKAIPDLQAGVPYTYVVEVDSISGPVGGWCAGHTAQSDSYQPAQIQGACWASGEISPGVHVMTLRGRTSVGELLDRAYLSVSDGLPLSARFRISLFAGSGVSADNFEYAMPGWACASELPVPQRDGYEFDGWETSDGVLIDANTAVRFAEDHILIARWLKR